MILISPRIWSGWQKPRVSRRPWTQKNGGRCKKGPDFGDRRIKKKTSSENTATVYARCLRHGAVIMARNPAPGGTTL